MQLAEDLGVTESDQQTKRKGSGRRSRRVSESVPRPIVRCWTDGSVLPSNPGPGGWAYYAYFIDKNGVKHEVERSGSNPYTSNIRMELIAALRFLQSLSLPSKVYLMTDSQYIIDGLRNLRRDKLLKTHYDVWGLILHLSMIHHIATSKVKAHTGVEENERVDKLAKTAAKEQPGDPYMWSSEKLMAKLLVTQKTVERRSWEY